jgi:hypothetical protein
MFEQTKIRKEDTPSKITRDLGNAGFEEFVAYMRNPWRIIWANLLAGIFRGLGFVIGATVVLAITVWILVRVLGNLPIVGEWFQNVGEFVQNIETASQNLGNLGK